MPLLRYFATVGAILILGLFALSAYLEPVATDAGARIQVGRTSSSIALFSANDLKQSPVKVSDVIAPEGKLAPAKPTHTKVSHRPRER
jgi:hypothetical protein